MPKLVQPARHAVLAHFVLGDEDLQLASTTPLQLPLISHLPSQAKIDGFLLLRIATNYISIQLFKSLLYFTCGIWGAAYVTGKAPKTQTRQDLHLKSREAASAPIASS
jgi:hypothetical protein